MHRNGSYMNSDCDLCHTTGDNRNPFIGSSDGTVTNPGLGCVGCHGREQDAGNDGISAGRGAGLRQHHYVTGTTTCAGCHTDANPANYTPAGENVVPTYYGTIDTMADMPCNPVAQSNINENWTIDGSEGLDNDGDNIYDAADPDCLTAADPVPDIKANGSDGPVSIASGDILLVTVSLDSGSHGGENADWWLVADTPFGWYYYHLNSNSWRAGFVVTYQGPLFDLSPFEVLNMSGLPVGDYTFHFGVDMIMNGSLDIGQIYSDSVDLTVMP